MASSWQRCETCRKIRPAEDFVEGSTVCAECTAKAERAAAPKPARASAVRVTRAAVPAAAVPRPDPEGPILAAGTPGRGDREVRVRRARLRALEALAAAHPEEFETLLAGERTKEKL